MNHLRDDEMCLWLVEYPSRPGVKRETNYPYTRSQAEEKFGPGWCEPILSTRCPVGNVANRVVAAGGGKGIL